MYPNGRYIITDSECKVIDNNNITNGIWTANELKNEENSDKEFSYEEAIELAGTGWYNLGLMVTTSMCLLAMCIDMFSFSAVIPLCACDFQLNMMQKSVLLSMPFTGPILTAYVWGYVSDTRGRKLSLILGMFTSFLMSTLCAFAPNWITLAILKLIGTCFCSCAQSATFALLGESCPEKSKGKFLIIMSSIVHLGMPSYFILSYLIGHLSFSYDLGLINFVPWRFLVIVFALPLGFCAVALMFFYESHKFLLNADREEEALDVLRLIHTRNCGKDKVYPVKKVVLNEVGNIKNKDVPLWKSLKDQTLPLFKPPLLGKTFLLYYLIAVAYAVSGALYVWLPFIAQAFTAGDSNTDFSSGLCDTITQNNIINDDTVADDCRTVDLTLVIAAIISGSTYSTLNAVMSKFASRKRVLLMLILIFGGVSCFLSTVIPNRGAGIAYLGVLSLSLCMGPLFAYYVDLYPTSFRGMAACLGVMVARISSVVGINLAGPFITTKCTATFWSLSAFTLSGVVFAFLLPPDRPKSV